MNKKSISEKAASTLAGTHNEHSVWVNGETNSMAVPFAIIGSSVGVVAGIVASAYFSMYYELNSQFWFVILLIPLFLLFFGALSGAIVGIGTPTLNTDPMQGWLVSWRRFAFRNS